MKNKELIENLLQYPGDLEVLNGFSVGHDMFRGVAPILEITVSNALVEDDRNVFHTEDTDWPFAHLCKKEEVLLLW